LFIEIDSLGADALPTLSSVAGVTGVTVSERRGAATGYEVMTAPDRDVRRELASAVVGRGWGLLELRPMRMSLEEIFLSLTTEETDSPASAGEAAPAVEAAHE
jgi:ABC-2 type transport system ATP-binding protein